MTEALPTVLDNTVGGVVRIDDDDMGGDPSSGVVKHFDGLVEVNRRRRAPACREGEAIDST